MLLPILASIVFIPLDIALVAARSERQFNKQVKEDFLEEGASPENADTKENFFRYVRAYDTGEISEPFFSHTIAGLPRPGGFKLPYLERFRRNIQLDDINEHVIDYYDVSDTGELESPPRYTRAVNDNVKIEATHVNIEESLGKPLEIGIIEANINVTTEQTFDKDPEDSFTPSRVVLPKGKALVINDFIRFRRDVKQKNQVSVKPKPDQVEEFNPLQGNPTPPRTKRERLTGPDGMAREARGATTEQWIKQPYPVIHPSPGDPRYDDSLGSAAGSLESIASRAPRVNFVTQRRSSHDGQGTSLPPLLFRSPEHEQDYYYYYNSLKRPRESKMWHDGQRPVQRPPPLPPAMSNDMYYQARPYRYQNQYFENPYYDDTRDRRYYDPNRRFYDMQDRYVPLPQSFPPVNRQRRIIYYTTLPEVVRSPPSVDMREKFNKYGGYGGDRRYDSRYVTSSPLSVGGMPSDAGHYNHYRPPLLSYPNRHMQKPRNPYDTNDEGGKGGSQGVKVSSADVVSVHELKKNPERRIFGGASSGSGIGPPGSSYADQEAERAAFRHGPH